MNEFLTLASVLLFAASVVFAVYAWRHLKESQRLCQEMIKQIEEDDRRVRRLLDEILEHERACRERQQAVAEQIRDLKREWSSLN